MYFRQNDEKKRNTFTTKRPFWKILVVGLGAGTANGLFGAGGGLVLVPLLTAWIHLPEKKAFATSLAIMLPVSAVSFLVYMLRGGIEVGFAWPYLLGGVLGGVAAGWLFPHLPVTLLRRVMAVFLLYGGVRAVLLL